MGIRIYGTSTRSRDLRESEDSRKIVSEIMNYGISQRQIYYIIYDLGMNLENPDHCKKLTDLLKLFKDDIMENDKSSDKGQELITDVKDYQ
jgi:hypothetical protein